MNETKSHILRDNPFLSLFCQWQCHILTLKSHHSFPPNRRTLLQNISSGIYPPFSSKFNDLSHTMDDTYPSDRVQCVHIGGKEIGVAELR